jgi:hypothetical protein
MPTFSAAVFSAQIFIVFGFCAAALNNGCLKVKNFFPHFLKKNSFPLGGADGLQVA